jgi:putative membrane protein
VGKRLISLVWRAILEFFKRLVISALSLGVAASIIPGIVVDNWFNLFIAAFLLGLVNAFIRPLIVILTLPVTLITLGLFLLVINAAMLALVAWILPGFHVGSFGAAFMGWLLITTISWLASKAIGVG